MNHDPRHPRPWERQPRESSKAFYAFTLYRDTPPRQRSLASVAQRYGASEALISRWSARWRWTERVRAWDDEQDAIRQKIAAEAAREMVERHIAIAMALQQKVIERLQSIRPKDLSPSEMRLWLDTAVRIERLARGDTLKNGDEEQTWVNDLVFAIQQARERFS